MKAKFNKLDRSKLSKEVNSILDKIKKATDNFKKEDKKAEALFDRLYDKIKEGKPEAIKSTKKPSKSKKKKTSGGNRGVFTKLAKSIRDAKPSLTWKQAMAEASKKLKADKEKANKKFSSSIQTLIDANKKYFGSAKASSLEKDAKQPAKPIGKRRSKKGKTYYEYRTNRTDVKQPPKSFPMLEKGGLTKDEELQAKISAYDFMGQFRKTKNIVRQNFGENTFKEFDRIVRDKFSSGKNYEQGGVVDLFENYETLPKKVRDTIDFYMEKYQDGDYTYEDSKRFLKEMQKQGYTFEYGLDNEPYDLRKMSKGGEVNVKIKDWYKKNYPTDDLGEELNDTNTFEDVENALNKGDDVFEVFEVGDSIIRERLFQHLAKIKGVSYGFIYEKWLSEGMLTDEEIKSKLSKQGYAKGGKIGFEGLAKKVAKNYEGKKVKPKFQSEYGKTYDKEEAMQVGRAVAGKVLKQQNMKKMEDGGIVRNEGVAYQGGMSYGTTENIAPQFEHGGNVNRGSFNVTITMKDGRGADILPIDVSEEDAKEIADMINNMKPMSARAEVSLPFAKGGKIVDFQFFGGDTYKGELIEINGVYYLLQNDIKVKNNLLGKEGRKGYEYASYIGDDLRNAYKSGFTIQGYAKGGKVYDLRDRLIDLGDEDFVEFEEKQSDDPNLLYYTFKERLEDYHGEEVYAKGGIIKNSNENNLLRVAIGKSIRDFDKEDKDTLNKIYDRLEKSKFDYAKGGSIKGKKAREFLLTQGFEFASVDDEGIIETANELGYKYDENKKEWTFSKGGVVKVGDKVVITDEAIADSKLKSNYGEVLRIYEEEIYDGAINTLVEVKTNDGKINVITLQEVNKLYAKGGFISYEGNLFNPTNTKKHKTEKEAEARIKKLKGNKYGEKGIISIEQFEMLNKYQKGGKTQGYNARLDESLGNRKGRESTKQQSKKDRRDESKGMEKGSGRRAYSSVSTMDVGDRMMEKGGSIKGTKVVRFYYDVYNNYNRYKNQDNSRLEGDYKLALEKALEKAEKDKKDGTYELFRGKTPSKLNFEKGGKLKAKKEIAEGLEELEVGLAGASKKHKQQSKLAKQIKDGFESSFAKGGNVPKRFLDEKGERKNDPETIEELTEYVMSLPQTKSKHYNKVTKKYSPKRQKLHRQIINKFKGDLVCIESDEPIAILMGGSPASGKSTFLRKYAPYLLKEELLRIDADEVRAMLPEYKGWNASATHNETQDIVKTLLSDRTIGVPCKYDLIFDGTMTSPKKYLDLIRLLKKLGYKVFVVFIDKVPKDVIMKRAMDRYKKSGRFVPPFVIEEFFESGKDSLAKVKAKVDGYMIVDGSDSNYRVAEQKGLKLPKTRKYSRLGVPLKKRVTRKKR